MNKRIRLLPTTGTASPTETAAERLAAEMMEAIDAFAARIANLESPHPSTAAKVRGARTVPRPFITSLIAVMEAMPDLQAVGTFDTQEARATLQFNDAFRKVADRLAALTKSLNYTMEARLARVTKAAMITYTVAKGLGRKHDDPALPTYLATLRRDLGRTQRSRKRTAESEER